MPYAGKWGPEAKPPQLVTTFRVEPRRSNVGPSHSVFGGPVSSPDNRASNNSAARAPIDTTGCDTADTAGCTMVIHGRSSNATSEMSRGTRNRRRCNSCHTPDAIRLFAANTAVTSGCASSNVDNADAASPDPNPTRPTNPW